jgi:hypothetical protein
MRIAYLNVIKSVRQRALVQHWREIGGGSGLPSFEQFSPPRGEHDSRQMMCWTIEGEDAPRRFKSLQHGQYLGEAFGGNPLPLQQLQALVPPPLQRIAIDGLNECADARAPVYWVISTRDANGRRINCERLLLPFGDQFGHPRQIITSLQLITFDGEFTRQNVLAFFAREATVTFKARIAFREQVAPASSA